MNKNQLTREASYCGSMEISEQLLKRGIITQADYIKIRKHFLRKYRPVIAGSSWNPKSLT
jgi:hypothetical protein